MGAKMTQDEQLTEYLKKRDKLFADPTLEEALKFAPPPKGGWMDPFGPLAAVHKARLQWLNVTDKQIEESMRWLQDHNYSPKFFEAEPYTPETRNAERRQRGLEPL